MPKCCVQPLAAGEGTPGSRWVGCVRGPARAQEVPESAEGTGLQWGGSERAQSTPCWKAACLQDHPPHPRSCLPPFPKCPRCHLDTQVCRTCSRSISGCQGPLALSREQPWEMMGLALVNPACRAAEWTSLERLPAGLGNAPIIPQ